MLTRRVPNEKLFNKEPNAGHMELQAVQQFHSRLADGLRLVHAEDQSSFAATWHGFVGFRATGGPNGDDSADVE